MRSIQFFLFLFLLTGMLNAVNFVRYAGHYSTINPGSIEVEEITSTYARYYMDVPCPDESTGYMCNVLSDVGISQYTHGTATIDGVSYGPVIGVYNDGHSNEWHSVSVANLQELDNGVNEHVLDNGFTISPNIIGEIDYGDGTKTVFYQINDLSNTTIRARITTCPNTVSAPANDQDVLCVTNFAFIQGPAQ